MGYEWREMDILQLIVTDNMYASFGHVLYRLIDIVRREIDASCRIDDDIHIEAEIPRVHSAEIDTVIGGKTRQVDILYL